MSAFRRVLEWVLLLGVLNLIGCAVVEDGLRQAGESYQCEREAANRPDEAQRRAECQQRVATINAQSDPE
ncbi:MAG: hypothetical protein AAGJ52_09735 [Pseudomonadota bacterium]